MRGLGALPCTHTYKTHTHRLRGNDVVGSTVKISVLKKDQDKLEETVDFCLKRADMRSVMKLKDLYLALGELHTEMGTPRPDRLKQKVDVLEQRIQVLCHDHPAPTLPLAWSPLSPAYSVCLFLTLSLLRLFFTLSLLLSFCIPPVRLSQISTRSRKST